MQEKRHILENTRLRRNLDWSEWKQRWHGESISPKGRLSMLHELNDIYWENETLIFLLQAADRWGDCYFLKRKLEHSEPGATYKGMVNRPEFKYPILQSLCNKAFTVLCNNFFETKDGKRKMPFTVEFEHDVFPHFLWFFRRHNADTVNSNICPISISNEDTVPVTHHHVKIAFKFAKDFCFTAWNFKKAAMYTGLDPAKVDDTHTRLLKDWERILDLMLRVNSLDNIINTPGMIPNDEIYRGMCDKVLFTEMHFPCSVGKTATTEKRLPKSIEEAVALNSELAQIVLIIRAKKMVGIS